MATYTFFDCDGNEAVLHSYVTLDGDTIRLLTSSVPTYDAQGAIEQIAQLASQGEGDWPFYLPDYMSSDIYAEDQDGWITLGDGDALRNGWGGSFTSEAVSAEEQIAMLAEDSPMNPKIEEVSCAYEYREHGKYGKTIITDGNTFKWACLGHCIAKGTASRLGHGFFTYFVAKDYSGKTEPIFFASREDAQAYIINTLQEERQNS